MAGTPIDEVVAGLRRSIGGAIFERIAGADGGEVRRRLREADAERWFEPGSPITRVHGDASMFIGGLSALLLQSLHPLAMAGVAAHSGFRGDPWGRLARTSRFLAVTTFGSAADAQRTVDQVRAIHRRVPAWRPTAARTRRPTRTCWRGCTSPRSTASCAPTSATAPSRLTAGGVRRVRRPVRPRRRRARCGRRAGDGRRARRAPGGLPARARRYARGAGGGTLPRRSSRRCRCACGRPTCRSPVPPWPCCRGGRAGRCACRGCRSPRRRWPAPVAKPSRGRSAGRCRPRRSLDRPGAGVGVATPPGVAGAARRAVHGRARRCRRDAAAR